MRLFGWKDHPGGGDGAQAPPAYFERVRAEAAARCALLERDPVLAAPGQQLFKQIRNPRFVLSELLQNADDAGARSVRAWISDGAFHFEHDGDDFAEEHFASLCRFGFSNKRHLHTIGFRGLGFKSVFSYGPVVELTTPSLSVRFHESRFTEPVWHATARPGAGTRVSVPFRGPDVAKLAGDELQRWASSPVPLLFFRSIRELDLGGHRVRRVSRGEGPVPSSEWVDLEGTDEGRLLVIRSLDEALPEEAIEEVRGERMDPDFSAADASIQLVLGLKARNRLYVVLPTTVEWSLPFALNAPFVQDPARTAIKEPAQSPLNRWLLQRAGQLAAETLLAWLQRSDLSMQARAAAYDLLGSPRSASDTLAGSAAAAVLNGMQATLATHPLLLTTDGSLVAPGLGLDLPPALVDVWPPESACGVLGDSQTHVVAAEVPARARDSLASWQFVSRLTHKDVVERLARADVSVPRPDDEGLRALWAYLADGARHRPDADWIERVQIFPAHGEEVLRRSPELVAPDDSVESISDDDWEYLNTLLPLVDVEWLEAVGIHAGDEAIEAARSYGKRPQGAVVLWAWSELADGTDLDGLIARAAKTVVDRKSQDEDAVPLAHVAARLGVSVDDDFPYLTSVAPFSAAWGVISPREVDRDLIAPAWLKAFGLSDRYEADLTVEELSVWRAWAGSPNSRLKSFVSPAHIEQRLSSRKSVEAFYRGRGGVTSLAYPYRRDHFVVDDYDFGDAIWKHWETMAAEEAAVWSRVVEALGRNWVLCENMRSLEIHQEGNRYRQKLEADELPARWLHRLSGLSCLPNEFGHMEQPGTLLRHTPNTAFLHGVEPFLHPDFDRTDLHPLLDALGVRSDPSDAATLLARLRALVAAPQPPMEAVQRIYLALDRLFSRLPGDRSSEVVRVLSAEALIRTDDGLWSTSDAVFVENAEQLPGVAVLSREAARLALWRQVGVAQRPDSERILGWLRQRTLGEKLEGPIRQRVRALLAGMPERVWTTCQAWIDLEDRWVAASHLRYRTSRPAAWQRLFSSVRMQTADVSMVAVDHPIAGLFESLAPLEEVVNLEPLHIVLRPEPRPEWVAALARSILRVEPKELQAPRQTDHAEGGSGDHPDHLVARELLGVGWAAAQELQVVPHIDKRTVGAHRTVHALWSEGRIVVAGRQAVYYKELVEALSARLITAALRTAVAACVERTETWIEDYFATEFRLLAAPLFDDLDLTAASDALTTDAGAESAANDVGSSVAARVTPSAAPFQPTDTAEPEDEEPAVPQRGGGRGDSNGQPAETGKMPGVRGDPERPVRVRSHQRTGPAWLGPLVAVLEEFGYVRIADEETFRHEDGGWAVLGADGLTHAVAFGPDGTPRAHWWVGDAPLASGVEIPADAWAFLERSKASSWIILPEGEGVVAHPMATLDRTIEVFPALYRIRLRTS